VNSRRRKPLEWELARARDTSWELAALLEVMGWSRERQSIVRLAKRLTADLRSLEALDNE
jgi:hypothetical protein